MKGKKELIKQIFRRMEEEHKTQKKGGKNKRKGGRKNLIKGTRWDTRKNGTMYKYVRKEGRNEGHPRKERRKVFRKDTEKKKHLNRLDRA